MFAQRKYNSIFNSNEDFLLEFLISELKKNKNKQNRVNIFVNGHFKF